MDAFENKIKKIRSTIDDIRNDIESMKNKNDKTLTNMVHSISNVNKEREPSLTHREKHITIEKDSYLSDVSLRPHQVEERPPLRDNFNKFTMTNYEYKNKNLNSSFENRDDSRGNSRRRPHSNKKMKDSFTNKQNNSYLSDFNDGHSLVVKDMGTKNYENKFEFDGYKAQTERLTENNLKDTLRTEASQTAELEKQIAELHIIINDLSKKNALLQAEISKNKNNPTVNNIDTIPNPNPRTRNLNQGPVRSQSEQRKVDSNNEYNFIYSTTIERGRNAVDRNDSERSKQGSEKYVPQLNAKRHSPVERVNSYDYKGIVEDISKIMGNTDPNNIVIKFDQYMKQFKENKIRDEFISKLSEIYNSQNNTRQVDVKILWRWVKDLIKMKNNDSVKINNNPAIEVYKQICENIIKDYFLKDAQELQNFINELLEKNIKNKKRVDKIKKLLMTDPQNNISKLLNDSY